uniref:LNS2/PITP domain-containing protein n=1 Tax=Ditylenchus dipsaci TaxID=166011 RepID=A0A915DRG5_9BILA
MRRRAGTRGNSPGPGSFSDSELEARRLSAPAAHAETEWKWGEIPESTKVKEAKKLQQIDDGSSKRNAYIWSWFSWSKRDSAAAQQSADTGLVDANVVAASSSVTVPANSTSLSSKASVSEPALIKSKSRSKEDTGLYLEDIADDPTKMAKYFGKRSGTASVSSNVDSGTGVSLNPSLGTSPCSPSALSLIDEPIESSTPDKEEMTPTTEEISTAIQKDKALEQELLAGTDEHASTPRTIEAAEVEAGNTAVDLAKERGGSETPIANAEVAAEKTDQIKRRYDSGNSALSSASDFALSDEEIASIEMVTAEYKRSLRLSSDQLKSLRLQYGSNEARFRHSLVFLPHIFAEVGRANSHIRHRWNHNQSDVLGHVIPAIGGTWAHTGVAELYTHIKSNGYRMIYLSSRAIGLSHHTKNYLKNVKQGTKKLPDGPVLLSPTSVLMALRKEVIERRPDEFKIACLSDLKALFPAKQPFFAGFGNRPTDVKSYMAVGIPPERILIINPSGIVSRADRIGYSSDYASMANNIVDYIFPPIGSMNTINNTSLRIGYLITPWGISANACSKIVDEGLDEYIRKNSEVRKKSQETPTTEEISTAIQKDKALEQELLAGTDEHASTPRTIEAAEVEAGNTAVDLAKERGGSETPIANAEVAAEKTDQIKRRYDSGNSALSSASDFALSDEEIASIEMVTAEYKRSLRLSSDQLKSLRLQYGSNEARFSITTKFQGTAWCSCHIYLLKWDEQIVISDIDGTITKSDVLGHVIPAIGGTWAHTGVAELYTHIKSNGYRMIYLSSRAIGLSHHTKNYLKNVKQGTKKLPDGPVLLSPTSVLMALRKEVIERRPDEFKIACLSDLKALFPAKQPFFAGFGNRPTVRCQILHGSGHSPERILIINPSGIVSRADRIGYSSDYASMANNIVDYIFPPIGSMNTINNTSFEDSLITPWGISANACSKIVDEGLDEYIRKNSEVRKKSQEVRKKSETRK